MTKDKGIRVNDMSLDAYLDKHRINDKDPDVAKLVDAYTKVSVLKKVRVRYPDLKETNGPIKHLSRKEILEEYGMKTGLPYENTVDNIVYCIVEAGPVTTQDLITLLDWKKSTSSLAARLSSLKARLRKANLVLFKVARNRNGSLVYSKADMSGREAVIAYNSIKGKNLNLLNKYSCNEVVSNEVVSNEVVSELVKPVNADTEVLSSALTSVIEQVLTKELELNVKVNVDVTFNIK